MFFITGILSVFCTLSQYRPISILCILSQTMCQCVMYSVKSQTMCQYLQLYVPSHTVCQCIVHFITDDVSVLFALSQTVCQCGVYSVTNGVSVLCVLYHRRSVSVFCILSQFVSVCRESNRMQCASLLCLL